MEFKLDEEKEITGYEVVNVKIYCSVREFDDEPEWLVYSWNGWNIHLRMPSHESWSLDRPRFMDNYPYEPL